ncbi:MAG: DUF1667 domain-containing protein [Lachnospiraceae bacterium]|nr:DUF1667 domain-containing protein [Lachnospiraceae bacterium]
METRELICIGCPMGCNLTVTIKDDNEMEITGNTCNRGADYARKELTDPRRIVTSTVRVRGGKYPVTSVKTASDIPKGKIKECVKALSKIEMEAPVRIGDVVLQNVADTGVDIVATKNV